MSASHLERSFCQLMSEVRTPEALTEEFISGAWTQFECVANNHNKAVKTLKSILEQFQWTWPRWEDHTANSREESMAERIDEWSGITAKDLLLQSSAQTLKMMCEGEGITLKSRATKQVMADALLDSWTPEKCSAYVAQQREADLSEFAATDVAEVASALAIAISVRAYNSMRFEQLMENSTDLPYWKFVWGGDIDPDVPHSCKKFDGQWLHFSDALKTFPIFGCQAIACRCRVVAHFRVKK